MNNEETISQLNLLVEEAKKTKNFDKLKKFCISPEYQALPYAVKNKPFITSSKLKTFEKCQLWYKYEYLDMLPKPEGMEDKDCFVIGRALDDRLTLGEEYYKSKYIIVQSRTNNIDEEIETQKQKIFEARNKLNKDGSRSAIGVNMETAALERINKLSFLRDKMQLTETMAGLVDQMKKEFEAQEMFNHKPTKEVFFHEAAGFILKAELDDFQEGKVINDIKSAANILNFDPENYVIQATFYNWLVEENRCEKLPVRLEIVDKFAYFSRSLMVEYTVPTLESNRGRIIGLLEELRNAHDSGLFFPSRDPKIVCNSPYYGVNGYGRPSDPIYY